MNDQQSGDGADTPSENSKDGWVVWAIAYIKCKFQERRANKQKESAADRASRRTANATIAIAFFTFVTIVVGAFQFSALHSTDEKIGRQIAIMEAGQRPWITAAFQPINVTKAENGIGISITITMKNIGHAPALNVYAYPKLVLNDPSKLSGLKKKQCEDALLSYSNVKNSEFGVLFPGNSLPSGSMSLATVPIDEIRRFQEMMLQRYPDRAPAIQEQLRNTASFAIVGCINYQFFGASDVHQTGFVTELVRKFGERYSQAMFDMRSPNGVLPATDLKLVEDPLNASAN